MTNYNTLKVAQLRDLCKQRGIKYSTRNRKQELIDFLTDGKQPEKVIPKKSSTNLDLEKLSSYTVQILKQYCKANGIVGYSAKKIIIINKIRDFNGLDPVEMPITSRSSTSKTAKKNTQLVLSNKTNIQIPKYKTSNDEIDDKIECESEKTPEYINNRLIHITLDNINDSLESIMNKTDILKDVDKQKISDKIDLTVLKQITKFKNKLF